MARDDTVGTCPLVDGGVTAATGVSRMDDGVGVGRGVKGALGIGDSSDSPATGESGTEWRPTGLSSAGLVPEPRCRKPSALRLSSLRPALTANSPMTRAVDTWVPNRSRPNAANLGKSSSAERTNPAGAYTNTCLLYTSPSPRD